MIGPAAELCERAELAPRRDPPASAHPRDDLPALLSSLVNFQLDVQEGRRADAVLTSAQAFFLELRLFRRTAFYLAAPPQWDFQLVQCHPREAGEILEAQVAAAIDSGLFGWALQQSRPVVVQNPSSPEGVPLVFHSIGTRSRIYGMMVGEPIESTGRLKSWPLGLVSVVLTHCASALENQRLQQEILQQNRTLQEKVSVRTNELVRAQQLLRHAAGRHQEPEGVAAEGEEKHPAKKGGTRKSRPS